LKAPPFSVISEVIGHGSPRLDSLYDFISRSAETNREIFDLMEFVRFQYCSRDATNAFFDLLSEDFSETNASMYAFAPGSNFLT
jgi:hypothetical protein